MARNTAAMSMVKRERNCGGELTALIVQMKAEIKAIKDGESGAVVPDGVSQKKRAVWDYMPVHSEATNKSEVAKAAGVDRSTAHRHYEEIRKEISHSTR